MIRVVEIAGGRLELREGSFLVAEDLSFSYPEKARGMSVLLRGKKVEALRGVNLGFDSGILLIVGANGSGKSTLCFALSGILKPDRGFVEIGGRRMGEEERMRVTSLLVGDRPYFIPNVRVETLLRYLSSLNARVGDLVEAFGLRKFYGRYLYTLSRGELARVTYAIWLSKEAEVYIGDEVGMGVDREGVEELVEVMRSIPSTFVLTSPDRSSPLLGVLSSIEH